MAWATLNSIELSAPSSFSEGHEVIGGYNTTLGGSKRRYIKAIKKTWSVGYDVLTTEKYDELMVAYNSLVPSGIQASQPYLTFVSATMGINEQVHLDISDRQYIPGTNLLSSITLTLTQL